MNKVVKIQCTGLGSHSLSFLKDQCKFHCFQMGSIDFWLKLCACSKFHVMQTAHPAVLSRSRSVAWSFAMIRFNCYAKYRRKITFFINSSVYSIVSNCQLVKSPIGLVFASDNSPIRSLEISNFQ